MKKNILAGIAILALPVLLAMGEHGIKFIFWGLVFRSLYRFTFPVERETA
jgi:hypothetical protein